MYSKFTKLKFPERRKLPVLSTARPTMAHLDMTSNEFIPIFHTASPSQQIFCIEKNPSLRS